MAHRRLSSTVSHVPTSQGEHQRTAGLLQPLDIAEGKWEHITMDFVTHLPRTSWKHDAVWVKVDRLTKSTHFLSV